MINVNKLRGKIVECGLSVADLAKLIGCSAASLYRKMEPSGQFLSIKEARLIGEALDLSAEEMDAIFFCPTCRKYKKKIICKYKNEED